MNAALLVLLLSATDLTAEVKARLAEQDVITGTFEQSKVVKGFNTLFASVLQNGGKVAGTPATVLLAGDDAGAVAQVEALVKAAGLKAIVAGPLAAARNIEAVAALNIGLGYGQGKGTDIAPTWVGI